MEYSVVVGLGELGRVFAGAFLRQGSVVVPVVRDTDIGSVADAYPDPTLCLVAVGEADLHPVLDSLPASWLQRAGLLQNELLPRDWKRHGIADPTVAVVWFEKKAGKPVTEILPTPVAGPAAAFVVESLAGIGIDAVEIARDRLEHELVAKNLYILTANIAGLETRGTVGELWDGHRPLAEAVAEDVLAIQECLVGHRLDRAALVESMVAAFRADPDHGTVGRSAPVRLRRALAHADDCELPVPTLRSLAAVHLSDE